MTRLFAPAALLFALVTTSPVHATEVDADAKAVADITAQLQDFLAHVDQRDTHDRFWASDLVYTSSAGSVTNKAEILKSFDPPAPAVDDTSKSEAHAPDAAKDAPPAEEPVTFTADDIQVRPYGDTAALTFRLVQHGPGDKTQYYRNSGMFVRRDGRWQAVTWQATKVPEPEAK
jgi:hypothetical protein